MHNTLTGKRMFTAHPDRFGERPSVSARQAAEAFKQAVITTVLELGAGQGPDTFFFAQQGFHVYALDYSEEGVLNTSVVEFVSKLPSILKLRHFCTKYLLNRSLQDLLPYDLLRRPKKGFGIPLGHWIRHELRDLFQDALDSARIARQGFFRPEAVGRPLTEHLAGLRDNRKQLWNLFVFQIWSRAYLDGCS